MDYLKSAGKDTLLAMQGLVEPEKPEKPSVPKDNTMVATAKVQTCNILRVSICVNVPLIFLLALVIIIMNLFFFYC